MTDLVKRLRAQKTVDEMHPDELDHADFIYGHEMCVLDGRLAADRITELEAALQAKEDGLKVRDRRIAALEAAAWALFWHVEHDHQCLVRRPNGINLQRCTCGLDEVKKDWKALAGSEK